MRVLLTVSYDGTGYCGWQRQKEGLTVQSAIEEAVSTLYGQEVIILGASRTDSGVHALGQMATFTPTNWRIPVETLFLAINSHLPADIRILRSQAVPDSFHVINDAKRKTYAYRIQNRDVYDPVLFRYTHNIKWPLDLGKMISASECFIGEHDFKAFCAAHSGAATTRRKIFALDLSEEDNLITIKICGSGFLYNMVRIVAGTLLNVGLGKTRPEEVAGIIESGKREKAGITLPAKGLTLLKVEY